VRFKSGTGVKYVDVVKRYDTNNGVKTEIHFWIEKNDEFHKVAGSFCGKNWKL
jgi:hypothetical protein